LKIFHLLSPARFGGLERVVFALAAGQKQRGHEVAVVCVLEPRSAEPPLIGELRNVGVEVIPVTQHSRAYHKQRRALLTICAQSKPDILHSHGSHPDVLAASLGTGCKAALVSTAHGFTGGGYRNRLYQWMQLVSYRRFDAIVVVSRKLAADLGSRKYLRGRVHTLPNAWFAPDSVLAGDPVPELPEVSGDAFRIVWVGRMSHEKGPDILIEALASLKDLPVHVTMIGDGAERSGLESRAKLLQLDRQVSWAGEIPRASRLLSAFDLLVISSRTEGTPITLFEALHAGVPVVATAVGGIPDVVSDAEAILIPPGDIAALSSAIRRVVGAPAEARHRAAAGRKKLEVDFAPAPWLESYERIYRDAVARRGRR
jgi:glycosyltransferase involved in cell wall biosynthesis